MSGISSDPRDRGSEQTANPLKIEPPFDEEEVSRKLLQECSQSPLIHQSDRQPVVADTTSDRPFCSLESEQVPDSKPDVRLDGDCLLQDQRISSSTPIERRSRNNSTNETNGGSGASSPKAGTEQQASHAKMREPTIMDYMYTEIRRGYDLGNDEQRYMERREKFYIFLKIPVQLEKVSP